MQRDVRFHSLDALRGLAALAVVLWHWQNFFLVDGFLPKDFDRAEQPLFEVLRLFYVSGDSAVDLFFSLSGFVFFWMYSNAVAKGEVPGVKFFLLRFSRLYPLHFATLMMVVAGQAIHESHHGQAFVYGHNDGAHIALHLAMLQSVGLEAGLSLNAPTWSVSVEAVLYLLFFLVCARRIHGPLTLAALSLFGFFILARFYLPLGRGVGSFFAGGLVFLAYRWIDSHPYRRALAVAVVVFTTGAWIAAMSLVYMDMRLADFPELARFHWKSPVMVLFPATILSLAITERATSSVGRRLAWLGNISYSSYLLHFPLQLAFAITLPVVGLGVDFYRTTYSLLLFMALLVVLSAASYHYFEMPTQSWVRGLSRARRRDRSPL